MNSLIQLVSSSSDVPAFLLSLNVESSKLSAAIFPPFAALQSPKIQSFDNHLRDNALFDLKDRAFPFNNFRNHFPLQVIIKSTSSFRRCLSFGLIFCKRCCAN